MCVYMCVCVCVCVCVFNTYIYVFIYGVEQPSQGYLPIINTAGIQTIILIISECHSSLQVPPSLFSSRTFQVNHICVLQQL